MVLEVVNVNEYPLRNLYVELEAIGLDYEALSPLGELSALRSIELTLPCRFRKGEHEPEHLSVYLFYEFGGRSQVVSKEFPVTVTAMMERQVRRFR